MGRRVSMQVFLGRASLVLLTAAVALAGGALAGASQLVTPRVKRVEKRESEMVKVPAGWFGMGASDADLALFIDGCVRDLGDSLASVCAEIGEYKRFYTGAERLQIYVSDFWIDRYETTTAEYRECVQHGPCDMRPLTSADERYVVDEWPVVSVTWSDADTYCRWRGKRLPTEAEWEKAARGTDGRGWPWGIYDRVDGGNRGALEPEALRSANPTVGPSYIPDDEDGFLALAPPGSFRFGKSPYGVHDMSGNVAEWVADWYDESFLGEWGTIDPSGPKLGPYKGVRGGSFFEPPAFTRPYIRGGDPPDERSITRGFRCARGQGAMGGEYAEPSPKRELP